MFRKTLKQKFQQFQTQREKGITVIEVMIAFVIIAIILVATGYVMSNSFRTSASLENQSRASGYAAEQVALFKQADFRSLYIPLESSTPASMFGPGKCSTAQTTFPASNMQRVASAPGDPYPGLEYCKMRQAGNESGGIGTEFYIQTKIAYVTSGQGVASTAYFPKRILVEVKWQDVLSGDNWHTYTTSYTRTPSPADCIPDTITAGGTVPIGCRP